MVADVEPNDIWQDRGHIKVTDGTYVLDVTSDGQIKVKVDPDISDTEGGQKYVFTNDQETRNLLNGILKQMKLMNFQLSLMTDCSLKPSDVEI